MNKTQIVPVSALASCKKGSWLPSHWDHYDEDGKCNCDRACGYTDEFGGPCILPVDEHPKDRRGALRHDDGRRAPKNTSVWVR